MFQIQLPSLLGRVLSPFNLREVVLLVLVPVLAGIELIFFLVAGIVLFWVQYEKNVDNTLMFSVVAKQCLV